MPQLRKEIFILSVGLLIFVSAYAADKCMESSSMVTGLNEDLLEAGCPSPMLGSDHFEVLDKEFCPKGSSPKFHLSMSSDKDMWQIHGNTQNEYRKGIDVNLGEGMAIDLTVCLTGLHKGELFLGILNLSSDTLRIYKSTDGGGSWNIFRYIHTYGDWLIYNFSLSALPNKLVWFVEYGIGSNKTLLRVIFSSYHNTDYYSVYVDSTVGEVYNMTPSIANDAIDYPSEPWCYLTYAKKGDGYDVAFMAIDTLGGVHSNCSLDGTASSKAYCLPEIVYARDNRIMVSYLTVEDSLVRARFSPDFGEHWTGKMNVSYGGDDTYPRIAGYHDYACVVMEDYNDGIAYNYTHDFGSTWSGSYVFGDSGDVTPAISVSPEEANYYMYYSKQGRLARLSKMSFLGEGWSLKTIGGVYADIWEYCGEKRHDICSEEPSIPIGVVWIDKRYGYPAVIFDTEERETIPSGWEHITITQDLVKSYFHKFHIYLYNNLGITDTIVPVEYIYANFSGRDNQEKIRNFIKNAVNYYGTEYVLLGGDVEIVPYRKTFSGIVNDEYPPWYDTIPCDLYYSDLDGDWDANGNGVFGEPEDSVDMYPDVWVGRIPASTSLTAMIITNKISTYCNNMGADYTDKILLVGMNLDDSTYGESTMEDLRINYIPSQYDFTQVYYSQFSNHAEDMLNALNDGQNIVLHASHGNIGSINCGWWLGIPRSVYSSDISSLTNAPNYSIFISIACLIGAFDESDCIMEHFIWAPDGGGVACMTNSRFGWYMPGQNPQTSYSTAYLYRFVDRIFGHSPASCTDFLLGKADMVPTAEWGQTYRWCMYALNLFGDPAMPIWTPYTGIEESSHYVQSTIPYVTVYPNPCAGNASIRLSRLEKGIVKFVLYGITGRKLAEKEVYRLESIEKSYNLSELTLSKSLPSGVYFLTTQASSGEKVVNKITVLH